MHIWSYWYIILITNIVYLEYSTLSFLLSLQCLFDATYIIPSCNMVLSISLPVLWVDIALTLIVIDSRIIFIIYTWINYFTYCKSRSIHIEYLISICQIFILCFAWHKTVIWQTQRFRHIFTSFCISSLFLWWMCNNFKGSESGQQCGICRSFKNLLTLGYSSS